MIQLSILLTWTLHGESKAPRLPYRFLHLKTWPDADRSIAGHLGVLERVYDNLGPTWLTDGTISRTTASRYLAVVVSVFARTQYYTAL